MAKRNVEVEFSLIDGVSKGLAKIGNEVGSVSSSLAKAGAAAVAAAAAIAAIGIGAALTQGVKDAASFEVALDQISAKTGITGDALAQLGDQIKSIAQDASRTGDEGAAAFEKFTAEGFNAVDALAQLPAALNFATASAQGTADAVGSLTDNLDAFGLGAEDFSGAADVIVAASLKGGTSVQQMQAALQAIGPTARDVGLSLEESAAAIARLGQNGLESTKAGKALATVFDELRNPASLFRKELAEIGVNSGDFETVMARLAKGGKDTELAFSALGINGTAAIKSLVRDGGAGLAALNAELQKSAGITATTADALNDNLVGAFNRATEAFKDLRVEFVEPLLAPLAGELDSVTAKLRDFVASPEFEKLRTEFAKAFLEALDAAKKFAGEFDFSAAIASVNEFTKDTTAALGGFKQLATETATAIKVVSNTIASAFNAIQVATAAATTGSARLFENLTLFIGNFSDTAKESSRTIKDFADVAENELGVQVAQLAGNLESLAANFEETAAQTNAATDAQRDAIPVTQQLSEDQIRAANNAKVLADAELKHAEASKAAAAEAQALALGLDALGNVKPITAVDTGVDKIKTAYQETREQIQASIDATKEFAASSKDAAKAVEGIGDAAGNARNQLEEDLSSAVFQGLTEGFGRVTRDLAALRGVSEDVIRGELNNALIGATNTMVGLNNAIKAGDAEIEKLGGTRALEALKKKLDAAAEAAANIGENARNAASELDAMVRALQDSEDARNGDQSSIEKRRFEEELARIAELERASGGTNRAAAELARQLAKREHDARLAEINAEGRARVDSELAADQEIADRREAKKKASSSGQLSGSSGQDAFSRQPTNIVINVQALTGQQAIAEAARALADPIEKIRNARI